MQRQVNIQTRMGPVTHRAPKPQHARDLCLAAAHWLLLLGSGSACHCGRDVTGATQAGARAGAAAIDLGLSGASVEPAGLAIPAAPVAAARESDLDRPVCPRALALAPGDHDFPIDYVGHSRSYRIHVPTLYDGSRPIPLVLNIHGLTQDGPTQQLASQFDVVSDANTFAVVYPTSDTGSWNGGACCNPLGPDDVPFMRMVVAEVERRLCIDRRRVYATGMSNGALLSHRLACDAAELFAGVAPVAGVLPIPEDQCRPSRPIPVLQIHGSNDDLVGYEGGGAVAFIWTDPSTPIPAAATTAASWARRDGCASTPDAPTAKSAWPAEPVSGGLIPGAGAPLFSDEQARTSAPHTPGASCTWYRACKADAEVGLCVHDGGHDWASGSSTAIWRFFERHALP